jgi:YD repeat-containing protein
MPGAELDISFGDDLLGRTIGASQAGDSQVYDYDALGRQLSQAGASGTYSSRYDPAGRRTRITHPDGFFVTQEYLVTGEMTKIRENGGFVLAAFDYDDLGRRDRLVLGNGAVTDYGYDAVSRLETLGHDFPGTASDNLVTFTYPASQIESREATNSLYAWTGHGNGSASYAADGLNRLTSQTTGGSTLAFSHDARQQAERRVEELQVRQREQGPRRGDGALALRPARPPVGRQHQPRHAAGARL